LPHYTEGLQRSWLILPLLLVYLLNLGGVGFLGPDEPRYASVGREMARSGDLVTPRLNGEPWFEKPPLLYWMTAAGNWVGLHDEWAARLPVALLSVAFLVYFFRIIETEFSSEIALTAAAILATSAGWLAYSFAALTDMGMAATLNAAALLTLYDSRRWSGWAAGALLGLSILGKGFVPVALFAPLLLLARGKRTSIITGAFVVAAPWHLLCLARNGEVFWNDYFWKQHIARFFTPALEHVQPFWYYLPVLLGALFPWTPLAALLARRGVYEDTRVRILAAWAAYGFVFFSISRNKLPGYILPLLPALAVVLAAALELPRKKNAWLAACAVMLTALPALGSILPAALLSGIRSGNMVITPVGIVFLPVAAGVWWLASWLPAKDRRLPAALGVALAAGLGIVYIKYTALPALDRTVSVRAFWAGNRTEIERACVGEIRRAWQYGLEYYAQRPLPVCASKNVGNARIEGTQDVLSIAVP